MNKLLFFVSIASLLCIGLISCQKSQTKGGNSENIYNNDFESHFGFIPHVQKGKAHSGQYFYAMDSTTEFSLTFMEKFGNVSKSSYAKMKLSTQLLMTGQENAVALTIQVWDAAGNPIKVQSKTIEAKNVGLNKWVEASLDLNLIGLYAPDHEVRCFVYNPSRQNVYMDDMRVEFFQ